MKKVGIIICGRYQSCGGGLQLMIGTSHAHL
jgi:hypothetical protein